MAFGLGCFSCCQGCDPCDAACPNDDQNPAGFEVVHGDNITDGFLTWNNPSDYARTISGTFTLPGANFPCYLRLNVWKGVTSVPVEGEPDLTTSTRLRITCLRGKISLGFIELSTGQSVQFGGSDAGAPPATYWLASGADFPTVDGLDSTQHIDNEPQWWNYGVTALCADSEVSISARLEWDGVGTGVGWELYGHLLECWERLPTNQCLDCDGTPTASPDTLYLTISNFDAGGAVDANGDPYDFNGTYTIPKTYLYGFPIGGDSCTTYWLSEAIDADRGVDAGQSRGIDYGFLVRFWASVPPPETGACVYLVGVDILSQYAGYPGFLDWLLYLCDGTALSGSVTDAEWFKLCGPLWAGPNTATGFLCSFDWELST